MQIEITSWFKKLFSHSKKSIHVSLQEPLNLKALVQIIPLVFEPEIEFLFLQLSLHQYRVCVSKKAFFSMGEREFLVAKRRAFSRNGGAIGKGISVQKEGRLYVFIESDLRHARWHKPLHNYGTVLNCKSTV